MSNYIIQSETLTGIADAIRGKTGDTALLSPVDMAVAIARIQTGGATVTEKDVNFYDYDGTLVHSYTVAEAQTLTELPAGPEHEGLVFQKWNWTLENVKALTRPMNIGALYTTDDGTTRIYIHLEEGRTSPMLGIGVNGTVTVDWGDGTDPDTLTGTDIATTQWTGNHEYGTAGDYVIRLTVVGEIGLIGSMSTDAYAGILRYASNANTLNVVYQNAVKHIECGDGVISIGTSALQNCYSLTSITIPDSVTTIGTYAFNNCYSLTSITIPDSVTSIIAYTFNNCYSLASIAISKGVKTIGSVAFKACYTLTSITLPDGVTTIDGTAFSVCSTLASIVIPESVTTLATQAFMTCSNLKSIIIPDGVFSISNNAFSNCYSLASIVISKGVKTIGSSAFSGCRSLTSITIPDSVTTIGANAFQKCYGLRCCDFSRHTAVPTLSSTGTFTGIPSDCEIRVPAALYDEWIAATNWSTYASQIVAV